MQGIEISFYFILASHIIKLSRRSIMKNLMFGVLGSVLMLVLFVYLKKVKAYKFKPETINSNR